MATNNVNLGIGRATGMFYHAPENTALIRLRLLLRLG